jgi:hypothetical protein
LIYGNWARFSIEEMAIFGKLCAEDGIIIELLDLIKRIGFAVICLMIYPRLVDERREQPKSKKHARDASATDPLSQKSKKQFQSTSAQHEIAGYQFPLCYSQTTNDTDASGLETGWLRGGERDHLQISSGLNSLERVSKLTWDWDLDELPDLTWDSNLDELPDLTWDSNRNEYANLPEFALPENNETQLHITDIPTTQFPMTDNVNHNSTESQPATSEHDLTQFQTGSRDTQRYLSIQHNEPAVNTPAGHAISVF